MMIRHIQLRQGRICPFSRTMNPNPGSAGSWRPIWGLTLHLCRCRKRPAVSCGKQVWSHMSQCLRSQTRSRRIRVPKAKVKTTVPIRQAAAPPTQASIPIGHQAAAPDPPQAILRAGLPRAARPGTSLADPAPPVTRAPQVPAAGQALKAADHVSCEIPALNVPVLPRVPKRPLPLMRASANLCRPGPLFAVREALFSFWHL